MPSGVGQTHIMLHRGWEAVHLGRCRALQAAAQKLGHGTLVTFVTLTSSNCCSSHLGSPGEPSGATWPGPRGAWRPPGDAPTSMACTMDGSDDDPQRGKGINSICINFSFGLRTLPRDDTHVNTDVTRHNSHPHVPATSTTGTQALSTRALGPHIPRHTPSEGYLF